MNDLLSGLASAQGKSGGGHGGGDQCGGGGLGGNLGGIFGGGSIIWIIVLLFLCGGLGQGEDCGKVCACKPKHCKEYCRCGSSNTGGLLGLGGLGGLGSGNGCWWIIILVFLFACGNQNKDCRPKNIDCCDE